MGFLGQPEKFAGCGPLQFAHLAWALADLVHSEVRWPPEHFKHFGALAQNRVMKKLLTAIKLRRHGGFIEGLHHNSKKSNCLHVKYVLVCRTLGEGYQENWHVGVCFPVSQQGNVVGCKTK
ncbi:hypothetical protein TNIN_102911 [Trichonephila inaurata madagascariensis]|uniref:Uncharacterized protein n=1 Tax=Trichonephila inaurata madagascariensis TaxID=2747483 RepID=A0A8X6YNQ3_9ARAC|nr:hypothetical protein TNIN_102911 [Trichonephila inaurata madagascariensis]